MPSNADIAVYEAVGKFPDATKYPHAARWFSHITSYTALEKSHFGGVKKAATEYGPGGKAAGGAAPAAAAAADDDENDIDLFGSDDETDEEAEKVKAERLKAYQEKKSASMFFVVFPWCKCANWSSCVEPKVVAKSSVVLDVKPWDDETDMKLLEEGVRNINMEGLLWGASKLVPVGYGIKKLQIQCVIEDDKVSTDELEEQIRELEDYVQSTDIAAFQKI